MSLLINTLASLGAIYGATLAFKFLRFVTYWQRTGSISRYNYKNKNRDPWAFVTGASDGIGLALAQQLASSGFNIILHGRNPSKLEAAKKLILSQYPSVEIRIIIIDVCLSGSQLLTKIQQAVEQIKDLHLTILINNVGGAIQGKENFFKLLSETDPNIMDDVLAMNIRFTTQLTTALLPHLATPSLIMSTSSMASIALPWLALYGASKAFIETWTLALKREMIVEGRDVEVICIRPSKVVGVTYSRDASAWGKPDAKTFAKGSLGRVGLGRTVTEGVGSHAIMWAIVSSFPEWIANGVLIKSITKEVEDYQKRV